MKGIVIDSVQSYNVTDGYIREDNLIPSKTTHDSCQTNRGHRFTDPAGLFDPTLHPLWETRLQVRRDSRAWSQILPVGQLSRPQARAGLYSAELPQAGKPIRRQLPEGQANLRGDLQYQSRAPATERKDVDGCDGYSRRSLPSHRYHCFGDLGSQYAPKLHGRSVGSDRFMGGER